MLLICEWWCIILVYVGLISYVIFVFGIMCFMFDGSFEVMIMLFIVFSFMSNMLGVGEVDGIIFWSSLEYFFS